MQPGEHETVQARILEYAEAIGWRFVYREEAEQRRGLRERGLLMIDRNELEDQMLKNLAALGLSNLEHAVSIARFNQLLKDDYRGIIVTMIHKFRDMPADLNTRSNIYVLIDEAHRTTGGDLGNFLMAGLPNATFLGFTGTPVDKTVYGKGTFKTFGCEAQQMVKPHGFVLVFVGIFDKLEQALAFDSDEINAIVKDLKLLKVLFKDTMESKAPDYLGLIKRNFNDKDVDTLIEHFRDPERRKEFFKEYKEIERRRRRSTD